jgi:hypothetical protein
MQSAQQLAQPVHLERIPMKCLELLLVNCVMQAQLHQPLEACNVLLVWQESMHHLQGKVCARIAHWAHTLQMQVPQPAHCASLENQQAFIPIGNTCQPKDNLCVLHVSLDTMLTLKVWQSAPSAHLELGPAQLDHKA